MGVELWLGNVAVAGPVCVTLDASFELACELNYSSYCVEVPSVTYDLSSIVDPKWVTGMTCHEEVPAL